jgi:hypothetical protein
MARIILAFAQAKARESQIDSLELGYAPGQRRPERRRPLEKLLTDVGAGVALAG